MTQTCTPIHAWRIDFKLTPCHHLNFKADCFPLNTACWELFINWLCVAKRSQNNSIISWDIPRYQALQAKGSLTQFTRYDTARFCSSRKELMNPTVNPSSLMFTQARSRLKWQGHTFDHNVKLSSWGVLSECRVTSMLTLCGQGVALASLRYKLAKINVAGVVIGQVGKATSFERYVSSHLSLLLHTRSL